MFIKTFDGIQTKIISARGNDGNDDDKEMNEREKNEQN